MTASNLTTSSQAPRRELNAVTLNSTKKTLPVVFVSHGSPMLALEPGPTGEKLTALGEHLQTYPIQAILVISAHWLTPLGPYITSALKPEIIHDFYGFPQELYNLGYAAHGAPEIAKNIAQTLEGQGLTVQTEHNRGLDHGAWIPLRFLFPMADKPVLQLSMPWPMNTQQSWALGTALKPLREQGILIIASGSVTHNLHDVTYGHEEPALEVTQNVIEFTRWLHEVMKARDWQALQNYQQQAPHARREHPTQEHFLPLLIAAAASHENDELRIIESGISYGALAMDAFAFETSSAHAQHAF